MHLRLGISHQFRGVSQMLPHNCAVRLRVYSSWMMWHLTCMIKGVQAGAMLLRGSTSMCKARTVHKIHTHWQRTLRSVLT